MTTPATELRSPVTRAWSCRTLCLPVLSAVLLGLPPAAAAATPVAAGMNHASRADTTDVDRLVWSAHALQRLLGERDYAASLLIGLATREWPADVDAAAGLRALADGVGARRAELDACGNAADPVEGTLCALERLHSLAPAALRPALAQEAERLIGQALRMPQPLVNAPAGLVLQRQDALRQYLEARLGALAPRVAPAAPGAPATGVVDIAGALEPWLRARFGSAPGDAAASILAGNPALATLLAKYPVLLDVRGGAWQPAPLQGVIGSYNAFFEAVVDSAHGAARRIGGLAGTVAALPRGDGLAEWAAQRAYLHLAGRAAALGGASGEVAAGLAALGGAAVDLRRGLGDVPSLLQAGRSVAALALTGNVLGVASGLTALLQVAGIGHVTAAAEVRALRGVVDSLRVHADGRFDHLDAAVDSVLVSMSSGFARLERAVSAEGEASRREIAAVHADVAALGVRFDRLETNLRRYVADGFDREHQRALTRCLEHRERFAPPLDRMDVETFAGCLVEFRTRGTRDARDALLTDRETDATVDAAVVAALSDTSLAAFARRVPLVARAAAQRYGHGDVSASTSLVNAVEWATASEAYVRMLEAWPEHAAAVTPADLDALIAAGASLESWMRGLAADAAGAPRPGLFSAVLADYARGAAEMRGTVERFAQGQQERRMQRIPRDSLARVLVAAGGASPTLSAPPGLLERLPPDAVAAAMLGLHPLRLQYTVTFEDSVVRDGFRRPFLRGTRHERRHYVRPTLTVEALIGERQAAVLHVTGQPLLQRTEQMAGGADSERVRSATVHATDPTADFLAGDWDTAVREAEWRPGADAGALPAIRAEVEAELAGFAAQSVDALFDTVCTAGPATSGAAPEALAIRRALDTMTTARALLGAFVRAGFGRSVAFDPALGGLTRGGHDALPAGDALCALRRRGEGMLRAVWLEDRPGVAAAAAGTALHARLTAGAALAEPLELVGATLERLRAARRIQQVRVTPPQ